MTACPGDGPTSLPAQNWLQMSVRGVSGEIAEITFFLARGRGITDIT